MACGLYSASDVILLLGEGDFSFAASLARAFPSGQSMTSTSLDNKAALKRSYADATRHLRLLRDKGARVLHAIDAANLHRRADLVVDGGYDRVVWLFPHPGWLEKPSLDGRGCRHGCETDQVKVERHRELLRRFFASFDSEPRLSHSATAIHITTKAAVDGHNLWAISTLGDGSGWTCVRCVRFDPDEYALYKHKYGNFKFNSTHGADESFPLNTDDAPAVTYIFRKRTDG
ncbi:hypothetical protein M885DRAFT_572236 [Pelagophyceae sp. CCMP2097]|nr:hypothetical protein M885DRAFT_572236 [Pelagophyceae sp. CCMP2097]